MFCIFFFFNDTATTEIYTRSIVGSVRCVQETVTSHFVANLKSALQLLNLGLKHRQTNLYRGYESNQSHIFINIEVIHTRANGMEEEEQYKGVLTVIDLAGWTERSRPEWSIHADLSASQSRYHMNNMSDGGKMYVKNTLEDDVVQNSINYSLKELMAHIFQYANTSPASMQRQESVMESAQCFLVQLFRQNLKTDSKIYVLGLLNPNAFHKDSCLDTLNFVSNFRSYINTYICKRERIIPEESRILKELYEEENRSPSVLSIDNNPEYAFQKVMLPTFRNINASPIPIEPAPFEPEGNISKIEKDGRSREGSILSGILTPNDKTLFNGIVAEQPKEAPRMLPLFPVEERDSHFELIGTSIIKESLGLACNTFIEIERQMKTEPRSVCLGCGPHVLCVDTCLLYTSPSPRDLSTSRMPSSA
eukprot:TRINITY_DN66496_c0_g1_i1.p1 TRINITY_DN66496_c0_g1~~TRINITY_DN66496_c0_g1_i1.p1  ORF type:complete len:421 (+),score=66.86 TRINITY_DN66496_c0_g1_i1:78-1340(+)